jgi:hypothetical protein
MTTDNFTESGKISSLVAIMPYCTQALRIDQFAQDVAQEFELVSPRSQLNLRLKEGHAV